MCEGKCPEPLVQPPSQCRMWSCGPGSRELELGGFKTVNSSPALFQTATSASFGNGPGPWRRQKKEESQHVEGQKASKAAPLEFLSCTAPRSREAPGLGPVVPWGGGK